MDYQVIIDFLNEHDGVTQEYPLLRHLQTQHPRFFVQLGNKAGLYQKHFWLFHHLHRLNEQLLERNLRLIISPLEIRLCSVSEASRAVGETDLLKAFYLNEANLYLSETQISKMLRDFWEKYLALDQKAEAIRLLQLDADSPLDEQRLKSQYKKMAQQHHPDKGGDEEQFDQVRKAYQKLKTLL